MTRRTAVGLALLTLVASGPVAAQTGFRDSVTVVPNPAYAKGGLYRFFFGDHYRDLWTAPVRVPVLDLATFAGGLTPMKKGGGQQTKSLRFKGADGREYAFRSIDKDPTAVLPPDLRETFADRIFQDQVSSGHPVGALVAEPILAAAGILHAEPVMVVLPDDPALGEFRDEFRNMLGLIEERPQDDDEEGITFAGAKDILSTENMLERVDKNPEIRVDSRAFLLSRLTDVFLGDWDRHQDQWRWALLEDQGKPRWVPIPRDRDQAFVRFDGFLLGAIRQQFPQLVNFGAKFPAIVGATWNGRDLDRRFLTDLERSVWDSTAQVLQTRVTDQVLEEAVARLPASMRAIDGDRMLAALKARRAELGDLARRYYEHLAGHVDVFGSNRDDVARATRIDDESVEVTVARRGGEPYFRRRFLDDETHDVRIYLRGGADSVIVEGTGGSSITVRAIGGDGDDRFVDAASGPVRFYDVEGTNQSIGRGINTKPYQAIEDTANPTALPHRDWGHKKLSFPVASFGPDAGLTLGWGGIFTHWGFRKKPYASRLEYTAQVATGAATGKLTLGGRVQRENSRSYFAFDAVASGIEVLRWYGFGNETTVDPTRSVAFYRATQHQVAIAPSLGWRLSERTILELGPRFKYSVTELDDGKNTDRFIGIDRPFGAGGFGQIGGGFSLVHDTRDVPAAARKGLVIETGGNWYPKAFDVERQFAEVHGRVATYLSAKMPTNPTLALQAGGKKVFGTAGAIPFHEAAFLGSPGTIRGFRTHRFAGDGSVYGSAELRLHLTNLFIFVPGKQGVFGFYDWGRVYLKGEDSNELHQTTGAGLWLGFLTQGSVVSLAYGHSDEGGRLYARLGFAF